VLIFVVNNLAAGKAPMWPGSLRRQFCCQLLQLLRTVHGHGFRLLRLRIKLLLSSIGFLILIAIHFVRILFVECDLFINCAVEINASGFRSRFIAVDALF
jgi:hypothetical protein